MLTHTHPELHWSIEVSSLSTSSWLYMRLWNFRSFVGEKTKNNDLFVFGWKRTRKINKTKTNKQKTTNKNKTFHFSQGLCFFVGFCFSKIQFQDPILLEGRSTLHKKSLQHTRHLSINCSISSKKILQDYIQTCSHYLKNMQVYAFLKVTLYLLENKWVFDRECWTCGKLLPHCAF